MAYRYEKETGDIVMDGFENGIMPSPHMGIGMMSSVNTSTEMREVMCSYSRARQTLSSSITAGTLTALDASTVTASNALIAGVWITISNSTITNLSNGTYYVLQNVGQNVRFSTTYKGSTVGSLGLTGTADYTVVRSMLSPVDYAVEAYGANLYRYYVLDSQGCIWVNDPADTTSGLYWALGNTELKTGATGIFVYNGFVGINAADGTITSQMRIWMKPTVLFGSSLTAFAGGLMNSRTASANPIKFLTGNQSTLYWTDANFIGSLFATSGTPNIWSYCQYTATTTTGTISSLIGGTVPSVLTAATRIPAVFFTAGTKPTAITVGTIYYIEYSLSAGTFGVYAAASGGAAIDIETGAVGAQYFNTFYPISAGGAATYVWTPQACTLPFDETAQALAEISNAIIIGCRSNDLFQWDQVSPQASNPIALPENNVVRLVTVNNMAYAFAGSRGNIYVTNGSTSSLALKVPDYCSGLIEPYFVWGGAMYLRGRVYFSILDQTATHTGQVGGVWSFIPTENYIIGGANVGSSLRLENKNSYGSFNGLATVLIPSRDQGARGPQYWSGWYSSITSPSYGIDFSDTVANTAAVIDTDIIPTGTFLNKNTFKQVEYKLAAPVDGSGDAVSIAYRLNITDAFTSISNSVRTVEASGLSGYWTVPFQKGQWVQFQITLTPSGQSNGSFVRLKELRLR